MKNDGFAWYLIEGYSVMISYEDDVINAVRIKENYKAISKGIKTPFTDKVAGQIQEYFNGKRKKFDLPYRLIGTDFQIKVWKELAKIPYGELRTYKDIAVAIDNPYSSRAVGMANNKNPIQIIIPCHRVIGANGSLRGYTEGIEQKKKFLEIEKNNLENKDL